MVALVSTGMLVRASGWTGRHRRTSAWAIARMPHQRRWGRGPRSWSALEHPLDAGWRRRRVGRRNVGQGAWCPRRRRSQFSGGIVTAIGSLDGRARCPTPGATSVLASARSAAMRCGATGLKTSPNCAAIWCTPHGHSAAAHEAQAMIIHGLLADLRHRRNPAYASACPPRR